MAKKRPRKGKRSSKGTQKNKPTKAARSAPKIHQGREATVHFVPHVEGRGACSANCRKLRPARFRSSSCASGRGQSPSQRPSVGYLRLEEIKLLWRPRDRRCRTSTRALRDRGRCSPVLHIPRRAAR